MSFSEGGFHGDESFLGKIRKKVGEKALPILTTLSLGLGAEACDKNQEELSTSKPQIEQELESKNNEEKKVSQNSQDVLLDELSSSISGQSEDFQRNAIESYKHIIKAVGSKMYSERMSANKAGEIRYFKKIYGDIEYRKKVRNLIEKYSKEYDIPVSLVVAQAALESNFDQDKVAESTGALGMMQVREGTASDNGFTKKDIEGVEGNTEAGVKIDKRYFKNFEDKFLGLTAYAHGPTNLRKKLNSFFPQLTLSADKTVFDEAGKKKYFEMLKNGDLNIANLYMLDPVFFKYSIEIAAMGDLSARYLYDDVDHYPKVYPGQGYKNEFAKNKSFKKNKPKQVVVYKK